MTTGLKEDEMSEYMTKSERALRMQGWVRLVRNHASKHYERGGWDYVVEAWEDSDVAAAIGRATTIRGAIRNVGRRVRILNDRRQDVRSEIWRGDPGDA